ncbi:MaoC family dehydratase [Jatrophihabitans sp. DSM 45814]
MTAGSKVELRVGETRRLVVVDNLTRTQVVMYAGASGDYNPLHSDEPYAKAMGFPGIFAHGMLTMGLTGRFLTDWLGTATLKTFGVRFSGQVWPGDTLTTSGKVTALDSTPDGTLASIDLLTANQSGTPVLEGTATALLDS